jgi:LmbE family N-acetylglucosaminyl deacetylase
MNHFMSKYAETNLSRSAIVFSPHPDDETLGCGGTIIKKKRSGTDVTIVFMTDGRRSHEHLISGDELKSIRAEEALAASQALGLEENEIVFLEFEDGKLNDNQISAINRVKEILLLQQPNEVFIPYYKEPLSWSKDHLATNRIVVSALQIYGKKVFVYEYPIGFWCHWPWIVNVPISSLWKKMDDLKKGLVSGLSLLKDFRCSVCIEDVLELKRVALDQYRSQMTRLIPDPRWSTLSDAWDGEFLECFFQDHEVFRRYVFPTRS